MQFEQTYHQYFSRVLCLAFHYLKVRQDAEDITQEVFVKYWQNIGKVPDEKAEAFLMITAKNLCLNKVSNVKEKRTVYSDSMEDRPEEIQVAIITDEVLTKLSECIEKLPEKTKSVIKAYCAGMKQRQIMEQENYSLRTVKNIKAYGVKRLKEMLFHSKMAQ